MGEEEQRSNPDLFSFLQEEAAKGKVKKGCLESCLANQKV